MSRSRRVTVGVVAAVAGVALIPTTASAAPDQSLKDLVLSGTCPPVVKNAIVAPRTPFLFAPLRLMDQDFKPTGKWLLPYRISVTGEGLKTRHLGPGDVYTWPWRPPKNPVTCSFEGATKEDGAFQVVIEGPVLGR